MKTVTFSDVVTRCNTKEDRHNTDKLYYVGGEHISSNEMKVAERGVIEGSTIGPMFYCGFKPGDILFVTRNPHLRKCAVVDFEGICSEKTFVLETKDSSILLQEYLAIVMHSDDFWDYCDANKSGGVNYFVNWSTLAEYEFDLPPLPEQKRLAEKLWAAYEVKQSYLNMLSATDEMLKAQFLEMFGELPINGTIAEVVEKNIKSVKKTYCPDESIEYIDISSVDAKTHKVIETSQHTVSHAPSRAQQCVENGDILVSTVRPVNRNIAVVNGELTNLVASTGFCVLRPKDGYREFILSVVQSDPYTEKMCDKASGGLYPAVNNGDVLSYGIHIPEKSLLKKVSSIYRHADKSKSELHKSIESIDKVINSLINENL